MGQVEIEGKSVLVDSNGCDKIEAIEGQIRQLFLREGFVIEVSLNEPDPAQQSAPKPNLLQVSQREPTVRSHQNLFDYSTAGNDESDTPPDLPGQGRATSRELRANDLIDRDSAAVQPFKPPELIRFQTARISVDAGNSALPLAMSH